jgi:hypothetical protein
MAPSPRCRPTLSPTNTSRIWTDRGAPSRSLVANLRRSDSSSRPRAADDLAPGRRIYRRPAWRTQISARCSHARRVAISLCTVTRPTAAHLACFILLSSGRLSAPHRSCAILRKTAIGHIPGQAGREQVRRGFGAVDMLGLCRPQVQFMSPGRSSTERRSWRGCTGRMQFGRRKGPRRPVPTGRDNVRYCR